MRRRVTLVLLVLALLAIGASVSYDAARTFTLTDAAGAPIDRAYVAFQYRGYRPNFVHPVSYEASPLTLVRSDAGRLVVPGVFHVHAPFPIKTHPSLWVELMYVPRLHNALGQLNEMSPSRPGVFEIEEPGARATLSDLSDRPELWEGSLRDLASLIGRLVAPSVEPNPRPVISPETAALTRELIGHLRTEQTAFLAKYGDAIRPRPEMPAYLRGATADEQKRWADGTAENLARSPTWGSLLGNMFARELAYYEQWAAGGR